MAEQMLPNLAFGLGELERLLLAVADKVTAPTLHRYDCDEDEHLVTAAMTMLERGLLGEA